MLPIRENDLSVKYSDRFSFHCTGCGRCCRHVHEGIPVNSIDLFRLANHLKQLRPDIQSTGDIVTRYIDPLLIDNCGYFILTLKTVGPDDACIFLQKNRCSIHAAKPSPCRTYPLEVAPDVDGSFSIVLSKDYMHHFKGQTTKVRTWLNKYFSPEDREFIRYDFAHAKEIASLLRQISKDEQLYASLQLMRYRYLEFDLEKPFMPQFKSNHEKLISELKSLF